MARSKAGKVALWCIAICVVIGILTALAILLGGFRWWQSERDVAIGETDLRFQEVALPFTNTSDLSVSLPFMGSAVIDVDGDGTDEVFLGGGRGQSDQVLGIRDGKFKMLYAIAQDESDATMGAVSIDLDEDGRAELLLARESGIWQISLNEDGSATQSRLPLKLADNTTPLSIAVADINGDALPDFYISGYIKNELVEGQTVFKRPYGGYSHLFVSERPGKWTDATRAAGLYRQHNTFTAMFADIDNDNDADLVIAQDTGHVEMYSNAGDGTFTPVATPESYSYPMGIGAGDVDGNGFIDFYFSNVGHTLPSPILRGDLAEDDVLNTDWMLLMNYGGAFTDRAEAHGLAKLGFGWGTVLADMDLDGAIDALGAQNYAKFPGKELLIKYPGKLMLQDSEGAFARVEDKSGVANEAYAITPLVGDYNGDGVPDLIWANLMGQSKVFLSTSGTGNHITIRFADTLATLGARIELKTPDGPKQVKWRLSSEGLGSDQSSALTFGIGTAETADITIIWPGNIREPFLGVTAGTILQPRTPAPQ